MNSQQIKQSQIKFIEVMSKNYFVKTFFQTWYNYQSINFNVPTVEEFKEFAKIYHSDNPHYFNCKGINLYDWQVVFDVFKELKTSRGDFNLL